MNRNAVEQLIGDVISWDLCDHLCKNLLIKMECRNALLEEWITSSQTIVKPKRSRRRRACSVVIGELEETESVWKSPHAPSFLCIEMICFAHFVSLCMKSVPSNPFYSSVPADFFPI